MDAVARHLLTALCAVAAFVALCLQLGMRDPPPPPPIEVGVPGVTTDGVGKPVTVSGRAGGAGVAPGVVRLFVDRCEVSCRFQEADAVEVLAGVRDGDAVTVGGTVEAVGTGHVHLNECKLAPAPKPWVAL